MPTFKCRQCPQREFNSRTALYQHYRTTAGHPFCNECNKLFLTQASLEDHYRGKASTVHPNCPRCGKGFFNTPADLPRHYTDSIQHPTCLVCTIGFKDDAAYSAHGAAEHPECRCTLCTRQFLSKDELKAHLNTSDLHPKCTQCKFGFMDDGALDEVSEQLNLSENNVDSSHSIS
ncbi:hypothetical protein DFH08DRAFT_712046 [Mycena albidolilacea]|uniref:C2H2-type domain-containing protein n=1 Tax=Mycena albidolilacea TaxID=1033008 RepID=A0AAD7EHS3_9AGAR|nr:hypothetical protein DFH08DRAFT_712046 [Mycena albidolilacea]